MQLETLLQKIKKIDFIILLHQIGMPYFNLFGRPFNIRANQLMVEGQTCIHA